MTWPQTLVIDKVLAVAGDLISDDARHDVQVSLDAREPASALAMVLGAASDAHVSIPADVREQALALVEDDDEREEFLAYFVA